MFSKMLNNPIPKLPVKEIDKLISDIAIPLKNGNLSHDQFAESINKIFQKKIEIFQKEIEDNTPTVILGIAFNDTPEKKAKREMLKANCDLLQAWQNAILNAVEGKKEKNSDVSLNDVNGVLYEAAYCLHMGINPKAYQFLCLSTIHQSLDNGQWIHSIDGLEYTDEAKKRTKAKPTSEELNLFLKEKVVLAKSDEEWEKQLSDKSLPFSMRYDRIKNFITESNLFNDKELSPFEKIAYASIHLSAAQNKDLKIAEVEELKKRAEDEEWIDSLPTLSDKLNLKKPTLYTFEKEYTELFSETKDLHKVAEKAAKKIEGLNPEIQLPEVNTGLESFLDRLVQIKDEAAKTIDEAVVTVAKAVDEAKDTVVKAMDEAKETVANAVDEAKDTVVKAGANVVDFVDSVNYEPKPFFTLNKEFIWNINLPGLDQENSFLLTLSSVDNMANLGAYFKDKIKEISELPQPHYEKFKASFSKELEDLSNKKISEKLESFSKELQVLSLDEEVSQKEISAKLENFSKDLKDPVISAKLVNFSKELEGLSQKEISAKLVSFSNELDDIAQKKISEKSELFDNLNLYLRFALPFYLLKGSLSNNLSVEGQRRVEELSSLVMKSTSNALAQWTAEQPTPSEIYFVVRQTQKAGAYLSEDFQKELDLTLKKQKERKLEIEETEDYLDEMEQHINKEEEALYEEEEVNETDRDLTVKNRNTLETKRQELTTLKEQHQTEREQLNAAKEQNKKEMVKEFEKIEDYPDNVEYGAEWEFAASLVKPDSISIKDDAISLKNNTNNQIQKAEEAQKEEEQRIKKEEQRIKEEEQLKEEVQQRYKEYRQQKAEIWKTEKNVYLKLVAKEIERLKGFNLLADDLITEQRIFAFQDLKKILSKSQNIDQFCFELKKFETSTIPFEIDGKPRIELPVSEILKTNRFGKHEISEDTKSYKLFKLLKDKALAEQPKLQEKAITAQLEKLNTRLNSEFTSKESSPIVRKSLIIMIQELMKAFVQTFIQKEEKPENVQAENPVVQDANLEVQEKNPVVQDANPEDQPVVQDANPVQEEPSPVVELNLTEKAVHGHITKVVKQFISDSPVWYTKNYKSQALDKDKDVLDTIKEIAGVDSQSKTDEVIKRQRLLTSPTKNKLEAIEKIINEIEKLRKSKKDHSGEIENLLDFVKRLGLKCEFGRKGIKIEILPALVNDNITVRGVRDEKYGRFVKDEKSHKIKLDQVSPNTAYSNLGKKKDTFFDNGKSHLQHFIQDLPEKVNDPEVKAKPKTEATLGR
jgi:hypothetical protein